MTEHRKDPQAKKTQNEIFRSVNSIIAEDEVLQQFCEQFAVRSIHVTRGSDGQINVTLAARSNDRRIDFTLRIDQEIQAIVNAVRAKLTSITSLPKISGVDRTDESIRDYSTFAKRHSNEAIIANIAERYEKESGNDDLIYLVTEWYVSKEIVMSGEEFDDLTEHSEKRELIDMLVREKRIEAFWRRSHEETEELHIVYRHNAGNETHYLENGEQTDFCVLKEILTQHLRKSSLEDRVTIHDKIGHNTGNRVASSREEREQDEDEEGVVAEEYVQYVPSIKTTLHGIVVEETQISSLLEVIQKHLDTFEGTTEKPQLEIIIDPDWEVYDEDDRSNELVEEWQGIEPEEMKQRENIKVWDVEIYEVIY